MLVGSTFSAVPRTSVFYLRRCQLFHIIAWAYSSLRQELTNTSTSPSGPCRHSNLCCKHPIFFAFT